MHELLKNGSPLSFVDCGKGAPPLVLVHDIGCDLTSFLPQMEYFCTSHRVASVDLKGHGRSGGREEDSTLSALADDLAWLCYELGLYMPVLIGHGIGGNVCIEAASRHPDLPSAVVALGSPIFVPRGTRALVESFLGFASGLSTPAFRAALRVLFRNQLPPGASRRYTDGVLLSTGRVDRHVALSVWEDVIAWNDIGAISACEAPLLYVDLGTGFADLARLSSACPGVRTATVGASNHFAHLQYPERINSAIEAFVREVQHDVRFVGRQM